MTFVIRPARAEDVDAIAAWTNDTFSWGDYIPDVLPSWLEDSKSLIMVCVHEDDVPVALSRAQLLSPAEAFLSGARVHPDHRRAGMATAMNDAGVRWAKDRGARVARLAIEEDNDAARSQVVGAGYRSTSRWVFATTHASTGSRMVPSQRLRPATSADADAAWVFWSLSDLAREGHELMAKGWQWRRATRHDLEDAVNDRSLYHSPTGWVIGSQADDTMFVNWLATTPTDAPLLFKGLRELVRDEPIDNLELMSPATAWAVEALHREGYEMKPILIYSKAL